MSVEAFWDNDHKTIVRYVCHKGWTWDEFFAAKHHANQLMDTVSHKIGVIIESTSSSGLPPNILAQSRKGLRTKHPNTMIVVLIVTNPFLRTMVSTIKAISPIGGHMLELASTLDEARRICAAHLESLTEQA